MNTTDLQRRFYDMLLDSERWSPQQLQTHQRQQLAALLKHARAEVPFYQTRLDAVFTPGGDIDWDRWRDIPIVTRADLGTHRTAMQARQLPPGHGTRYEATTSGSTDVAVTTTHNGLAGLAGRAAIFRSHHRHGLDWSQTVAAWHGDDRGQVTGPWGPPWDDGARRGRYVRINRHASAGEMLAFSAQHGAHYFTGRSRKAQLLALEAASFGSSHKFEVVLGFATAILPDEREDCRAAFGARMIGMYSSKEGNALAHECPSGPHYHVNEETVLLEIVDDAGNPTPEGQIGRVVITPLYNTAQPLIRYEQGDLAIPGKPCGCGRTLKVIERVVGRARHLFRFPDGSTVAPLVPDSAKPLIGARHWQLAQTGPLQIEVRYVPVTPGYRGDETTAAEIVRSHTHRDAVVSFSERSTFEHPDGRKFIEYVNETDSSAP